jgi:hypothetical protein
MRTPILSPERSRRVQLAACTFMVMIVVAALRPEDWPEWRGKGRVGVWNEARNLISEA